MSVAGKLQQTLAAAACSVALIGCAAAPAKGWRVEGTYRLDGTGASAADGYLALGRQYEGEARHVLALNAYRKAARLAPEDADVMNALGLALAGQSQHGAAVDAFRQAVALDPTRSALLNNLGYALLLEGRTEEARTYLRQALVQEPGYGLAQVNLGRLGPLNPVAQPPSQLPIADAPELGMDAIAAVAPEPAAETRVAAEKPWPTVQLRVLPNVEPLSLTFADRDVVEPAPTDARVQGLVDGDATQPLLSGSVAPPQVVAQDAGVRIEISNGNGVRGMGARLGKSLRSRHPRYAVRLSNMRRFDHRATVVEYRPGFVEEARNIASSLGASTLIYPTQASLRRTDIRVLLGRDLEGTMTCVACLPDGSAIRVGALRSLQGLVTE